jgi:hypothetical protein
MLGEGEAFCSTRGFLFSFLLFLQTKSLHKVFGCEAGKEPNPIPIFWDAHRQLLTEFGGYLPEGKTPFFGSRPTREGRNPETQHHKILP